MLTPPSYKRTGATVTDKNGTKDTAEFFNIAKNDLTLPASQAAQMSRQWPPLILSHQPLLNNYMRTAHSTGLLILSLLATRLGINPSEITSRHRLSQRSGDLVRLTRGPPRANPEMPEIQTPSHTDFGTITLLMNWLGGLQVWSESARKAGPLEPDSEGEWLWVKPKKGCAIINLGDAMVRFTNGALCSGRHRVVPAPGEQGVWPRFSVVYFVRPEDECILGRLEGEGVPHLKEGEEEEEGLTAKAWIMKQARGLGTQFTDN
jgi:isopenicillin N synthase-like dioxygenase